MGPPRSRKSIHSAKKKYNRKYVLATKHRARDVDQIHEDLAPFEAGKMTIGEREGNGPWRDVM